VAVEVGKLCRQDVGVGNKIEGGPPKLLLHFVEVIGHTVLAGDLVALWKVIYSLVFIKAFVKVGLARGAGPQHVPLVTLGIIEPVGLHDAAYELRVASQNFIEELGIVNVIAAAAREHPIARRIIE